MQKTVTVIIPVYNGEKYISRCIKSVLSQDYEGIKLLVVNDGSSDASEEVIDFAIEKYNTHGYPTRVINQANAGVAAARNLGIDLADTDYIAFIDQDDFFRRGYIQDYMSHVEKEDFDMVIGGFVRCDDKGKITRKMSANMNEWSKYCLTYPWARIIRTQFLKDNNIRFLKTGIGEDVYFDLVAYSYTGSIKMINNLGYVWFDNKESVSNKQYIQINELVNPIYTFECVMRDINRDGPNVDQSGNIIPYKYGYVSPEHLEYYFVKFIVWYLITNKRRSEKEAYKAMKNRLWSWMDDEFPQWRKNQYLKPWKLKGEKVSTRLVVWGWRKRVKAMIRNYS